ncbi:MAG: methionyl-tRNA formyltransferase [Alphaproteobacteria bacterium]|nr:methionyl-tRNA formyltransferase [Alphaproteobacteria bacterium]
MNIVFMGTPDFAVPALRCLSSEHNVVCVYTREPKISGRGNRLNKTPVHLFAQEKGIEVRTPKTLRDIEEQKRFADLKADVAIIAAYGLILPKPILEAFPLGCVNIHASLLPRWRGAAPIQRAIEAGDSVSGVTIMQMAEGLDTGDMLLKGSVCITEQMTGGELHDKLAIIGAELITQFLADIKKYPPQPQNDKLSCYAPKLDKNECKINFCLSSRDLYNKIRAFNPYPAMFFEYNDERFKVLEANIVSAPQPNTPGTILNGKTALIIATADGALEVTQIQRQGKRTMSTAELLRGFEFTENTILR